MTVIVATTITIITAITIINIQIQNFYNHLKTLRIRNIVININIQKVVILKTAVLRQEIQNNDIIRKTLQQKHV